MRRSLLGIVAVSGLLLAACGDDDDGGADTAPDEAEAPDETVAPVSGSGSNIQAAGECGAGTGEEATGEPIKIGAMATNSPVADFTWITGMTAAYFECVNDNGGINGRPIEYIAEEEQVDPQQIAAVATKLVEQDQVLGIVGSTSLIECSVNREYYAEQGYYLIIAGVSQDCFTSPNFSAVNMGPYYSSLGGAQAALRAGAEGRIVVASPNQPGFDLINQGVVDFAEENGLEGVSILEDPPFADPAGFAQRLVQEAGDGGGVVLDYTGPNAVPLLQAIEQQGLVDSVIWASSTPPNDPSVAEALGPAWNDKFLINAEFNVLDSVATDALLGIEGDITKESVNEAFRNVKNFVSDIWCQPWYFESGVGANVSNNVDLTVAPRDGQMVQLEECFEIAELPGNNLEEIRQAEEEGGLNTGEG